MLSILFFQICFVTSSLYNVWILLGLLPSFSLYGVFLPEKVSYTHLNPTSLVSLAFYVASDLCPKVKVIYRIEAYLGFPSKPH